MISELIARIQTNTTSFRTIALAHSMEPIEDLQEETPALYAYMESESAASAGMLGHVVQDVTRVVHVFLVGRHADMDALRAESRVAIIGYAPTRHSPMEFVEGRIASIKGEWMWWLDTYATRTEYRQF